MKNHNMKKSNQIKLENRNDSILLNDHINVIVSYKNSNFRIYLHNKLIMTLNFDWGLIESIRFINNFDLRMSNKIYLILLMTTLLNRFGLITTFINPKDFY